MPPAVTKIDLVPNPSNVVMLGVDEVRPVTVKPKVASPPRASLSITMKPGVKVSVNVHVIVPPGDRLKSVGGNVVVPSVHEEDVRVQPVGMGVSDTVKVPVITVIGPVVPDPPTVVMSLPIKPKSGPVTPKRKVASAPIVCLFMMMVPCPLSVNVHVTVPPDGTGKFVGENAVVPSVHPEDARLQLGGMFVSDTV